MEIPNHKIVTVPGRRAKFVQLNCSYCNEEFTILSKSFYGALTRRQQLKFYCKRDCFNLDHPKQTYQENCLFCKEPFNKKEKEQKFCSRSCAGKANNAKRIRPPKVEKIVIIKAKKLLIDLNCTQCNEPFQRRESELKRSKHQKFFCSKSCRMTYQNLNSTKTYSSRRSKAEIILVNLIKNDFPYLEIKNNIRTLLPSKLEIDIFIPSFNLTIELNGPVHYFPIYGEEKLKKCQDKDIKKQLEIQEMKMNLLIIDISHLTSKKKTIRFLEDYYSSKIRPILNGC